MKTVFVYGIRNKKTIDIMLAVLEYLRSDGNFIGNYLTMGSILTNYRKLGISLLLKIGNGLF
jgi:hypothetical protein